eukprot:14910277-Alexandrium_andersonii.AAC.1
MENDLVSKTVRATLMSLGVSDDDSQDSRVLGLEGAEARLGRCEPGVRIVVHAREHEGANE